jgi:hypothetical protein
MWILNYINTEQYITTWMFQYKVGINALMPVTSSEVTPPFPVSSLTYFSLKFISCCSNEESFVCHSLYQCATAVYIPQFCYVCSVYLGYF